MKCMIEGNPVRCAGVVHSDGFMCIKPVNNLNKYMLMEIPEDMSS
jgi:hypothetical protein